jgi:hypothetical protein
MFNNVFSRNRAVYNVGKYGRATEATDDNITRRMCFSCCIPKATNTHLEYVIPIAFAQQRWLNESPSTLRYKYIASRFSYVIEWIANPLNLLRTINRSIAKPSVAPFLVSASDHPHWPSSRSKYVGQKWKINKHLVTYKTKCITIAKCCYSPQYTSFPWCDIPSSTPIQNQRIDEKHAEYTSVPGFPLRKFVQRLKIWIRVQKLYCPVFGEATDYLNWVFSQFSAFPGWCDAQQVSTISYQILIHSPPNYYYNLLPFHTTQLVLLKQRHEITFFRLLRPWPLQICN